jgi:glucokinase
MRALAVDIGGTKILTGLVDASGSAIAIEQVATPARDGADAIIAAVVAAARKTLAQATEPIDVCGVGTAGVVGPDGAITSATDLLPGWAGTPLAARLGAELGMPVSVLNDVHATGLCEATLGAAKGSSSALIVAIGTGIGGAIVKNGEVQQGAHGIAGSVGHLPAPVRRGWLCSCGALDHIEAHASGPSLEAEYLRRTGQTADLKAVAARAAAGDGVAWAVLLEGAEALGAVIGGANNLIDAEMIVIGGGVSALGNLLLDPLRRAAMAEALGPAKDARIVAASFGPNACLVGAGLLALSRGR